MASRAREKERRRRGRVAGKEAKRRKWADRRRIQVVGASLLALLLIGGIVAVVVASGDGEGTSPSTTSAPRVPRAELRSLPKPLAENVSRANQFVGEGTEGLEAKLADLRGFPVVANQWGSWCPPCRAEFPIFVETAEAHLKDVAFLGIDIQDDRGAAEDFLEELPTPYPHIFDEGTGAVTSLGWNGVSPTTFFIDRKGEVVQVRPGAYASRAELEADIDAFLLSG